MVSDDSGIRDLEEEVFEMWERSIDSYINWCKALRDLLRSLSEVSFSSEKIIEINLMQRKLNDICEKLDRFKSNVRTIEPLKLVNARIEEVIGEELSVMMEADSLRKKRILEVPSPKFGVTGFLLMPYTVISYHIRMFVHKFQMYKLKKRGRD